MYIMLGYVELVVPYHISRILDQCRLLDAKPTIFALPFP
jgi:hypothetical protein